jgi:hypothetical protein
MTDIDERRLAIIDVLASLGNICRHHGIDFDEALREAHRRYDASLGDQAIGCHVDDSAQNVDLGELN